MKPEKIIKNNRKRLDRVTKDLVKLIAKRNKLAVKIGKTKKKLNLKITDRKREKIVLKNAKLYAKKMGVNPNLIEKIMKILIKHSKKLQAR